jgi:hypothetical protein
MKFRSPTDEKVYVAMTNGHAAVVGPEFRELPEILHRKALEEGCITDNMDEATIKSRTEGAAPSKTNHEILIDAIEEMSKNPQDGEFVPSTGLPNLKKLSKRVGWNVSREEMMQAVQAIADGDDPDVIAVID